MIPHIIWKYDEWKFTYRIPTTYMYISWWARIKLMVRIMIMIIIDDNNNDDYDAPPLMTILLSLSIVFCKIKRTVNKYRVENILLIRISLYTSTYYITIY